MRMQQLKKEVEKADLNSHPWKEEIIKDDKGKVSNSIENYITYFSKSEKYKDQLKYNDFLQQKEFNGRQWNDFDEDIALNDIERDLGLTGATKARQAISEVFVMNRYNPVQDYLESLEDEWDRKRRIETVFIKLLDADDTPLNRAMSKKWFMAAVKRVLFPGCKFDNILIFQGAQGIGKTTICERISKGFSNVVLLSEIASKDIVDKLNKTWIGIVDEMDAFSKKDMTTIKTFLSTAVDSTRLAYGRNTQSFKRHSVFIGSTNDDTFLRDNTSSTERRFWIIKAHREKYSPVVNELLTDEYVDQLWAEAYHELMIDVNQYLDIDSKLQEQFAETQKEFKTYTNDVAIDYIKEILDKPYVLLNGMFNDNNDFLRQYTGENTYVGTKSYINKIPMSSLIYVLKNVYKVERNAKYIANALKDEWEYKKIMYSDRKTSMGLYRKEQNDEMMDENDDDSDFLGNQ